MPPKFLKFSLVFLFLCGLIVLFVYYNITRPRVLILHSYDTTYSWTRDVNVGLQRILDQYTNYAVRWHYMDTKRHPDPSFKRVAGNAAQRAIEQWQPHVVIAIDDDAQEFAAKHFVNHPNINLVFAGVNGEIEPYGYAGAANVTGILERKQLYAVKEIAQVIGSSLGLPNPLRLMHIADASGSVKEDARFMDQFDWAPVRFMGSKLVGTFGEWQQVVTSAPGMADIIVITNYRKLARSTTDKTLVSNREVMQWTIGHAELAIIGTNVFNVEDGANLAVGVSPYEQGEVAARMAIDIVEGERLPSDIPLRSTQQYIVSMRKEGLRRSGISLPSVYEAFARATNNYFDTPVANNVVMLAAEKTASTLEATATAGEAQVAKNIPFVEEVSEISGKPHPRVPETESPHQVSPAPLAVTQSEPAADRSSTAPGQDSIGKDNTSRTVRLEMQARQPSWAEVRDAEGRSLLYRTLQAGTRLSLTAVPPLRVKLGRPEAVQLNLDGHPLDAKYTSSRQFTIE